MSLLDEGMTECVLFDKHTSPDGYGGYVTTWSEGAEFLAAIVPKTYIEQKIAEQADSKTFYTVTTKKVMNLQYHDVFKRIEDGKVFRVTSDGDDNKTPKSAILNMRNVDAEEWAFNG